MSSEAKGRLAQRPREIPAAGWKDIALRLRRELKEDRVGFTSAGMTFYMIMGLAPLMIAFVGIYGLLADPAEVAGHVKAMAGILPSEVAHLVERELMRVAAAQDAAGIGFLVGIVLALWSGTKATDALVESMNIAYDETERRNFFWRKLLSLGLSLGAIAFALVAVGLLAVIPALVALTHLPGGVERWLNLVRWPLLFVAANLWLAVVYRYAPCRDHPKWRWVSWGAFLATVLWVALSAAFSMYVSQFANYSATYGSLAAVIVLLMWCFLSGFCIVLGAEINAEMEHQTMADTTIGPPEPMGERGAFVADHLGPSQGEPG